MHSDTPPEAKAAYRVVVEPCRKRVRVVYAGEMIADSTEALVLHETRLPPVYYFPREQVRMDLLQRTEHRTHCPFKGNASYWSIATANQIAENVVWSYENPLEDAQQIRGYPAFSWDAMEAWHEDDVQVLEGSIKRGDAEDIHAVIWFCDLRDSTSLTEALPREDYLAMLNQFFDCMAGAVLDHGGEVLKFIGDAILAIFPIEDPDSPEAAKHAIEAAQDAQREIALINKHRAEQGVSAIGFGIGMRTLRGVSTPQELFTLPSASPPDVSRELQ